MTSAMASPHSILFDPVLQWQVWSDLTDPMRRELGLFGARAADFRSTSDGGIIQTWRALADRKLVDLFVEHSGRAEAAARINARGIKVIEGAERRGRTAGGNVVDILPLVRS